MMPSHLQQNTCLSLTIADTTRRWISSMNNEDGRCKQMQIHRPGAHNAQTERKFHHHDSKLLLEKQHQHEHELHPQQRLSPPSSQRIACSVIFGPKRSTIGTKRHRRGKYESAMTVEGVRLLCQDTGASADLEELHPVEEAQLSATQILCQKALQNQLRAAAHQHNLRAAPLR